MKTQRNALANQNPDAPSLPSPRFRYRRSEGVLIRHLHKAPLERTSDRRKIVLSASRRIDQSSPKSNRLNSAWFGLKCEIGGMLEKTWANQLEAFIGSVSASTSRAPFPPTPFFFELPLVFLPHSSFSCVCMVTRLRRIELYTAEYGCQTKMTNKCGMKNQNRCQNAEEPNIQDVEESNVQNEEEGNMHNEKRNVPHRKKKTHRMWWRYEFIDFLNFPLLPNLLWIFS